MANINKRLGVAMALFLAASLAACQGGGSSKTEDTKEEDASKTDDEKLDEYADSLENTLKDKYGENYKVERDGLFVNASVWEDGNAKLVDDAAGGDEKAASDWEKVLSDLEDFSKELGESVSETNVKNAHVVLCLMDDKNDKRMLAMASDGSVLFDEVSASASADDKGALENGGEAVFEDDELSDNPDVSDEADDAEGTEEEAEQE